MLLKVFLSTVDSGMCYTLHKVGNDTKLGGEAEGRAVIRGTLAGWRNRPAKTLGNSVKVLYRLPAPGLE